MVQWYTGRSLKQDVSLDIPLLRQQLDVTMDTQTTSQIKARHATISCVAQQKTSAVHVLCHTSATRAHSLHKPLYCNPERQSKEFQLPLLNALGVTQPGIYPGSTISEAYLLKQLLKSKTDCSAKLKMFRFLM